MKNRNIYSLLILVFAIVFFRCTKTKDIAPTASALTSKDFLSAANYTKLTVEIAYINDFQPSTTAIDNLKAFLELYLNKPNGIEMVYSSINSTGKTVYNLDEIKNIETAQRKSFTNGKTIAAYILFIDGDYSQNNGELKTLGVAYGSSSMVIFEKTIRDLSGGVGQASVTSVETTVSEHEFGHIMGLVNNGTAMSTNHEDENHAKHCVNKNCLMFYATETSDILNNLLGNSTPTLDNNCVSDLKVINNK